MPRFQKTAVRACLIALSLCIGAPLLAPPTHSQSLPPDGGGGVQQTWLEGIALPDPAMGPRVSERLTANDFGVLGDAIDPYTGALSFSAVDVSIPGNSNLEVAVRRSIRQGWKYHKDTPIGFADWQLEVPRIERRVAQPVQVLGLSSAATSTDGLLVDQFAREDPEWAANRCSQPDIAPPYYQLPFQWANSTGGISSQPNWESQILVAEWFYDDFSYGDGTNMIIPGQGSEEILHNPQGTIWSDGGAAPAKVTKTYWKFDCISESSGQGEGFVGIAPNGDRYRFDTLIYKQAPYKNIVPRGMDWQVIFSTTGFSIATMLATEVTDVHGNWVRYTYNSDGLPTRIHSNDGREIVIAYNSQGNVDTITANDRVWSYSYEYHDGWRRDLLSSMKEPSDSTIPNDREWHFDLAALHYQALPGQACNLPNYSVSITDPNGVHGVFELNEVQRPKPITAQGPVNTRCAGDPTNFNWAFTSGWDQVYEVAAVTRKTLSGIGMPTSTWQYSYSGNQRTLIDPENQTTVTTFDPRGRPTSVRTNGANGTALRTVRTSYADASRVGNTFREFGFVSQDIPFYTTPYRTVSTVVEEAGEEYSTSYSFQENLSSNQFSFGQPTLISRSSTASSSDPSGSPSRTTEITYNNSFRSDWVVGLPSTYRHQGKLFDEYHYHPRFPGRVQYHDRFGDRLATYQYTNFGTEGTAGHARGQLRWIDRHVSSTVTRRTTFTWWKRGSPEGVIRPDNVQIQRSIDLNGWTVTQSDALGNQTIYYYNAVGWLTTIDRPGSWSDTTFTYETLGSTSSVKQTSRRGNREDVTWYDGLLRPTQTLSRDVTDYAGTSSFVRTNYDRLGRVAYQSLPQRDWVVGTTAPGATTTYDALGRVVETRETVAPFATTATRYLNNNRVEVTDPVGNVTTTTRVGFGSPDDGYVTLISQPEGSSTAMTYDPWGNMLTARQWGTANGYSSDFTQTYVYNNQLRVCQHHTEEQGSKLFRYDQAGQLTSYAEGQPQTNNCGAMPWGTDQTVGLSYTQLGQLDVTNFAGSTPDIDRHYDANGNLTQVVRGASTWDYAYHRTGTEDLLNAETLTIDGRTFFTRHEFNLDGYHSAENTVGGLRVRHFVDALGRPTELTVSGGPAFANNMTYHPNGTLTGMTLGNGRQHTTSINARQLVSWSWYQGAFTLDYSYDANGRVTSISDVHDQISGDRAFGYDGLGRLTSAQGPWGTGSYEYDPVGNLRAKTLGDREVSMVYDASNRLEFARDLDEWSGYREFTYDGRGNVLSTGANVMGNGNAHAVSMTYDMANQPTSLTTNEPAVEVVVPDRIPLGSSHFTRTGAGDETSGQPTLWQFADGEASEELATGGWRTLWTRQLIAAEAGARYRLTVDIKVEGTVQNNPGFNGPHLGILLRRFDANYALQEDPRDRAKRQFDAIADGQWRTETLEVTATETDIHLRPAVFLRPDLGGSGRVYVRNFRVEKISDAPSTITYAYDGNLKRVKAVDGDTTTYFVYGLSGQLLHRLEVTGGTEVATDYISGGGKPIARVTGGEVTYVYADHLGSHSVLADAQGEVIATEVLTPYGEVWAGASAANDNHPTFTGHVRDTNTGLTYMQARYYDPVVGRFLATDPVQFNSSDTRYFNRYVYAGNDPVNYWDADGRKISVSTTTEELEGGGTKTTHTIEFTASLSNPDGDLGGQNLSDLASQIEANIESDFSQSFTDDDGNTVEFVARATIGTGPAEGDEHGIFIVADGGAIGHALGRVPGLDEGQTIYLNDILLKPGVTFSGGSGFGRTASHEFGHAAGLRHPTDPLVGFSVPSENLMTQSHKSGSRSVIRSQLDSIAARDKFRQ